MSRFHEYDGDDSPYNGGDLWTHRAHLALHGRKGRKALEELREALLALPEKRLIEGALCTVGLKDRLATMPEKVLRTITPIKRDAEGRPVKDEEGRATFDEPREELVHNYERDDLIEFVDEHPEQPEGVCAIGAYVWWKKVKGGMDPAEAFAAMPIGAEGEYDTTDAGQAAGLTFTLAWELASRNDETWGGLAPEERYTRFMAFIDKVLAGAPLKRPEPRPKRRKGRAPKPEHVAVVRAHRAGADSLPLWGDA